MVWTNAKNGAHGTCKNHPATDSRQMMEKGTSMNSMEENGTVVGWESASRLAQDRVIWRDLLSPYVQLGTTRVSMCVIFKITFHLPMSN